MEQEQLTVIIRAQDLCSLIFEATDKSPKKFRATFSAKMQNLSMEIIEALYLANEVFVTQENKLSRYPIRRDYQHTALTKIKLLAYFANTALSNQAITVKQFEQIAKLTKDCQNLIGGWIKKEKKRWYVD